MAPEAGVDLVAQTDNRYDDNKKLALGPEELPMDQSRWITCGRGRGGTNF